jgi:ABC-type glycerol-3-phosphate transport system substrate-binding protein
MAINSLTSAPGIGMRALLGWIAFLVLLAGCQPKPSITEPAALPLAGQTVEIVSPAGLSVKEIWEPLLQEWQAATGGAVQWSEYDPGQPPWLEGAKPGELQNGGRVLLIPLVELSSVDAAQMISTFPSEVADAVEAKDIFPGLKEAVLSRQRKFMAAPVSAPVLLCYYRKDLLDAAGRTPPRTWNEYQQLLEDLPNWAAELPVLEPCSREFLASLFLARSVAFCKHPQNYSVWFDIQTGDSLFDSPGFERALETARRAWNTMPAEIWNLSPADCRQALLNGKAAMTLTWEPWGSYPRFDSPKTLVEASADPLPIGVVALPGSESVYHRDAKRWETLSEEPLNPCGFTGFTGLVLGAKADNNSAAAWNLLQMLIQHQEQAFITAPRSPCRESEVLSPLPSDGQLSVEAASLLVDATAETLRRRNVACDLAIPNAGEIRQILAEELAGVQEASCETSEVLAAIHTRISAAIKDRREVLRDEYRRSVGLMPLK